MVMLLVTHRLMQPDSRPESALEVKSSTHALKQLSTRLPKTWARVARSVSGMGAAPPGWNGGKGGAGGRTYVHKLLDLALLQAGLELALLGLCEAE